MDDYIWPEITSDTPLEVVRDIHRRIWDYVIEHGEKPDTPYKLDCVLCSYSKDCENCPARWSLLETDEGDPPCLNYDSPYYDWCTWSLIENDSEIVKEYAIKVRDIPFKEELKNE